MALNALRRHVALIGFMGAGKSTLAPLVAKRLARPSVDVDDVLGVDIPELFKQGEEAFRAVEEPRTCELLADPAPKVLALGGGSIKSELVRESLREHAFTVLVDVDVDTAWDRVKTSDRPLAQDEARFRELNDERRPMYGDLADATATDVDGVVLAAAGVHHELGALDRLGELVPGDGPVALITDRTVIGLHGGRAQQALGDRLTATYEVPSGEEAKRSYWAIHLCNELRLDRGGTIVALGGGAVTDLAGFVASIYLRGIPWVAVPTTVVGQLDAAIGGKTAVDIPQGKNLIGAFHWPARVIVDEGTLSTLSAREIRQGEAERIKTELLANRTLDIRGAAAYKAGIVLRDPYDRDVRNWLNLGHTFAHALEAAADFELAHGDAVALGLLAALRLSGRSTDPVADALDPQPVRVDRERAWEALQRDKKRAGDQIRLVLLGDDGPYLEARPAAEVRAALDSLIAQ
jgi:shikimate kinase/3-dehydroquinate synthase